MQKTKKYFADSELIINPDGSAFHLHLRPEQLADRVLSLPITRCTSPDDAHAIAAIINDFK